MREEADLLHVWDVTRRSVEQFDKNISDIRKMCLTVTGVSVSAIAYILSRPDLVNVESTLMWLGSFIIGMAAVFWILDDHYHNYLKITANVCSRLEDELELSPLRFGVSKELGNYREKAIEKYGLLSKAITDIVYISIGSAAIIAIFVINYNAGRLEGPYLCWTLLDAFVFVLVAFILLERVLIGKMLDKISNLKDG